MVMVANLASIIKYQWLCQDLSAWGLFWLSLGLASVVKMRPSSWERPGATLNRSPVSDRSLEKLIMYLVKGVGCLWSSGRSLTRCCSLFSSYHSGVQTGQCQCWYLPRVSQLPLSGWFALPRRQHVPLHLPAHRFLFLPALWKCGR